MKLENKEIPSVCLQKYDGVKTLVLGATGFIGRWVARSLYNSGAKVYLPVRDLSAAKEIFSKYEIEGEIYELDLLNKNLLKELIHQIRPAIIFNLAGYGIKRTEQSADLSYQINAQLVENLCEAVAETSENNWAGQNIIHTGTAMEYGAISGNLAEDSLPNPTTLYGKSKLAGTDTFTKCCQRLEIKGLTARLFAVYGPGESSVRLLPTLIKAAQTKDSIELTAGLHQRDFVYVEDVVEGLLRLGLSTAKAGEIVNLATGELNSIRHFTEISAAVIGISENRLKFGELPTRPEEMKHSPVTTMRLKELTEWIPKTTIADGVRKTLAFEQAGKRKAFGLEH